MPRAETMKELREMPTDELIEVIDNWDKNTQLWLKDHLEELARRDQHEQHEHSQAMLQYSKSMDKHTAQIKSLTAWLVGLTVFLAIGTVPLFVALFRG